MKRKRETRGGARKGSGPKPFVATAPGDVSVKRYFRVSLSLWTAAFNKAKAAGTNISAVLRDALKSYVKDK